MNPNGLTYWPTIATLDEINQLRAERGKLLADNMKLAKELEDLRKLSLRQAGVGQRLLAENNRLTEALLNHNQVQREGQLGAVRVYCDPRVPKLQAELEDLRTRSLQQAVAEQRLFAVLSETRNERNAAESNYALAIERLVEAQKTLNAIAAAAKSVSA